MVEKRQGGGMATYLEMTMMNLVEKEGGKRQSAGIGLTETGRDQETDNGNQVRLARSGEEERVVR